MYFNEYYYIWQFSIDREWFEGAADESIEERLDEFLGMVKKKEYGGLVGVWQEDFGVFDGKLDEGKVDERFYLVVAYWMFVRGESWSSSVEEICRDGEGYENRDRVKCALGWYYAFGFLY